MSVHVSQSASFSEWYISHMCWIRFMHLPRATQTSLPMVVNLQHPLPWVQGSAMAETPYEAKLKVSQCVWLFATPWAVACPIPVHEILQERILEWVAISFSRGSSRSRDWTWVFCTAGRFFTVWTTRSQKYFFCSPVLPCVGFPDSSGGNESTCNAGDWVWSLGWEDLLEKGKATHSRILAWRILWTV